MSRYIVNQPWIVIGRTGAETEAPILWPPMWGTDSLEKILMLGKIEGRRRRRQQRMRWLDGIIDSMDMSLSKLQEMAKHREAWHAEIPGATKSWTRLSDWTTTTNMYWDGEIREKDSFTLRNWLMWLWKLKKSWDKAKHQPFFLHPLTPFPQNTDF